MTTIDVVDAQKNTINTIALSDAVFNRDVHQHAIYTMVREHNAVRRRGTAKTKTRGEVSLSGSKLYRQKGTGRARAGSARSPLRIGGGTIFGPMPRTYGFKVPRKVRKLAIASILSHKAKTGDLLVVDAIKNESGKTRDFVELWRRLVDSKDGNTLFVLPEKDEMLWRSSRNIPGVKISFPDRLTAYDLLYYRKVVIALPALAKIEEVYGS